MVDWTNDGSKLIARRKRTHMKERNRIKEKQNPREPSTTRLLFILAIFLLVHPLF